MGGPTDPVLDAGEWTFESTWLPIEKVQQVIMASPNDARTGLQVKREFRIPATGSSFFEHTTFTNTSHRNVRWSLWEVCQIDTFAARDGATDSAVEVAVTSNHPPIELARYAGAVRPTIADGIARVPIEPGVAKFGFPTPLERLSGEDRQEPASPSKPPSKKERNTQTTDHGSKYGRNPRYRMPSTSSAVFIRTRGSSNWKCYRPCIRSSPEAAHASISSGLPIRLAHPSDCPTDQPLSCFR
jgi:hypothetical protein